MWVEEGEGLTETEELEKINNKQTLWRITLNNSAPTKQVPTNISQVQANLTPIFKYHIYKHLFSLITGASAIY